jgi:1,4-dihydroxy-2-naphthoyl-CoA hydrolase
MSELSDVNQRLAERPVPTRTTSPGAPSLEPSSLEEAGAFVAAAGLVLDEIGGSRVTGHIDLGAQHHTPWGIVHGGVYTTAIESAASIGASSAVMDQGMVAVGLTNTTHFLRSVTSGRVEVEAVALNQGRTQQLWQVDIKDGSGKLLAHGEVRLQNVPAAAA